MDGWTERVGEGGQRRTCVVPHAAALYPCLPTYRSVLGVRGVRVACACVCLSSGSGSGSSVVLVAKLSCQHVDPTILPSYLPDGRPHAHAKSKQAAAAAAAAAKHAVQDRDKLPLTVLGLDCQGDKPGYSLQKKGAELFCHASMAWYVV
jgi:hypothetical protein